MICDLPNFEDDNESLDYARIKTVFTFEFTLRSIIISGTSSVTFVVIKVLNDPSMRT